MGKDPINFVSRWVRRLYSTRMMLALLLAVFGFFWLFSVSHFPLSNPELLKLSRREGLLDLMPFYTAQEAFMALSHYGQAGRELYLRFLAADFIFIPTYCFGLAFLITWISQAVGCERALWLKLNVLPFGVGLFDCVENFSILGMLGVYPDASFVLGTLAGISTLCKHLLTVMVLLTIGYGGFILLMKTFGRQSSDS